MKSQKLLYCIVFLYLLVSAISSCQKDLFEVRVGATIEMPRDIMVEAKKWYQYNMDLIRKGKVAHADLDMDDLVFQWDDYELSRNSVGNTVLTVPIISKGASEADYLELGLILDNKGRVRAMIKEYINSPYIRKTPINLYTGTGERFMSGIYNPEKRTLLPNWKSKKYEESLEKRKSKSKPAE